MVPKEIGSIWKWVSSGMKIGQKITMISVHSSGQPSRKMISWAMIRKPERRQVHAEHPTLDQRLAPVQREHGGKERRADEQPADHRRGLRG